MIASAVRARSSPVRTAALATGPLLLLLVFGSAIAQTGTPAVPRIEPAPASESILRELLARVENLERRLSASALLELVTRLDQLAKVIQQQRERGELQARTIDDLQGRQRDLYAELDRLARRLAPTASTQIPGPSPGTAEGPSQATATEPAPSGGDAASRIPQVPKETAGSGSGTGTATESGAAVGTAPDRESPSTYDPVEEQARYQRAFDLLSEGRFERAATAFTEFLADFPESRYRDDAMFWKGECLYALRRFEPALSEFRSLVEARPESSRIPGAMLKIGFILQELGQAAEAAEVLRNLAQTAPDSSEAKLARDRLERLE